MIYCNNIISIYLSRNYMRNIFILHWLFFFSCKWEQHFILTKLFVLCSALNRSLPLYVFQITKVFLSSSPAFLFFSFPIPLSFYLLLWLPFSILCYCFFFLPFFLVSPHISFQLFRPGSLAVLFLSPSIPFVSSPPSSLPFSVSPRPFPSPPRLTCWRLLSTFHLT